MIIGLGPGHWHIVGKAEVHTQWPLPDFSFHVDEERGEDVATPIRKLQLAAELKIELEKVGNWSAQLPQAGDAFATFAKLPDDAGLLAHPLWIGRPRRRAGARARAGSGSTSSHEDMSDKTGPEPGVKCRQDLTMCQREGTPRQPRNREAQP